MFNLNIFVKFEEWWQNAALIVYKVLVLFEYDDSEVKHDSLTVRLWVYIEAFGVCVCVCVCVCV